MTTTGTALYNPVSLNREYLTGKLLERYAEKHPRIWGNLSLHQRVRVREEYLATIQNLEESLATGSPAFLVDQACWVQSRFAAGHFPQKFFVSFFGVFKDVLARELPLDYRMKAVAFAGKAISRLKPARSSIVSSASYFMIREWLATLNGSWWVRMSGSNTVTQQGSCRRTTGLRE